MLSILTGALGSTFMGSLGSSFASLLPSMFGSRSQGSGIQRSILDLRNQRDQIRSEQRQTMMMQQARATMGTARSVMAGSGFRSGSGSQTALGQQSMMNLERDLSSQRLLDQTSAFTSAARQKQALVSERQKSQQQFMDPLFKELTPMFTSLFGGGK